MIIEPRRSVKLIQGDSTKVLRSMPSKSIHVVVCSPPYWGLRDYQVDGQLGSEETFDEFLAKTVEWAREVHRVLHPSGTLWLNVGDSYNSSMTRGTYGDQSKHGYQPHGVKRRRIEDLHPKNLIGQPWRTAFALQNLGFILRSDIIWHKPNPMPSSVRDRPTSSHEYLFLFSKRGRYFYNQDAIREPLKDFEANKKQLLYQQKKRAEKAEQKPDDVFHSCSDAFKASEEAVEAAITRGANKRTVWSISTEAFPDAHYATFPRALVEPVVLAGSSEAGCCPKCYAPLVQDRISTDVMEDHGSERKRADAPGAEVSETSVFRTGKIRVYVQGDWIPTCKHEFDQPIPCTVLDPYSGSGTTGVVANNLGRNFIGIDLSPDSVDMSMNRIFKLSKTPLFTDFSKEIYEEETIQRDSEIGHAEVCS